MLVPLPVAFSLSVKTEKKFIPGDNKLVGVDDDLKIGAEHVAHHQKLLLLKMKKKNRGGVNLTTYLKKGRKH